MASVALIGGDGSGKTTVAKHFVQSSKYPSKYLYMGLSTLKSEPAFPTTLLIRYLKTRSFQKAEKSSGSKSDQDDFTQNYHHNPTERNDLWHAVRNLNYLVDVLYRQFFSFLYQLQGYLVIYDRHFLFMAAPEYRGERQVFNHWIDHALYWIFEKLYPKPDLIVFLDAPIETLYERKPEGRLDYLEKRRTATLRQGEKMKNFIRIDATQALHKVNSDFEEIISEAFGI